jgi:hypothetical protein
MISKVILFGLFTAFIFLMEAQSRAKFSYLHPRKASKREIAKIPKDLSLLIRHHDLFKWGGASAFWIGGSVILWLEPSSIYARSILYVLCACGLVAFSACLSWRAYAIAKR